MHPDLFTIPILGGRVVHTYGVLLLVGFLLSLWRAIVVARRKPDNPITTQDVLDVSICLLLGGIVGARLTFVLLDPHLRSYTLAEALAIWNGGISFDGALIAGMLSIAAFCKVRKISVLQMFDLIGPASVIGYAVGRIGCFFNGCCYGGPTDLPWGVAFPATAPYGLAMLAHRSHPAQLYSTCTSMILFGLLAWRQKKKDLPDGDMFFWYLIGSSIERFIMEIFRRGVTSDIVSGTPFTTAQWFCFLVAACGAVGLSVVHRRAHVAAKAA